MKSESGGKEIKKIEMMKKYLMVIIFAMDLSLTFAQIDSVEVIFKPYLIKVDQKDSTEFERIKKELEIPSAQNPLEMLEFANSIDPNANWKLVGRKIERWFSNNFNYSLLSNETLKRQIPNSENTILDLYFGNKRSEKNVFNSEFIFKAFMIKETYDFENSFIQIFNIWKPYYYDDDYLIIVRQKEHIGHSYSGASNEFYYFRKVE